MGLSIIPHDLNINFMKHRKVWIAFSVVTLALVGVLFVAKGPQWGIDFLGGAEVQVRVEKTVTADDIRETLSDAGVEQIIVQEIVTTDADRAEFLIKVGNAAGNPEEIGPLVSKTIGEKFVNNEITKVDTVGPFAGADLRKKGVLALFWAWVAIFIYILVRFDMRFAPGAIVALIHDSIITIGALILLEREFTISTVAAILTIIGYSVNDTIIVYDRIRENLQKTPHMNFLECVNLSINETLSRTFLTVLTVLIVCISLLVFGGGVIFDFALTMTIGFIVGTYSSIFIASAFLVLMDNFLKKTKTAKVA